jgi:hypothetical protein
MHTGLGRRNEQLLSSAFTQDSSRPLITIWSSGLMDCLAQLIA